MHMVKFVFVLILTMISVLSVFLLPESVTLFCFRNLSYYLVFITVACWLYLSLSLFKDHLKQIVKNHYPAIILSIIVTCLIFSISPPRFKTLTDEANLIGISMMMHNEKTVGVPIEAIYTDYGTSEYTIAEAKRPLLFPFTVSLFHSIFGYHPENGFILNFLVSIAIFFTFYFGASKLLSRNYGYIGILLLSSCPIYAFCISSSGFEALNLLFLLLTFVAMHDLLKSNYNPHKVDLLFMTALLLAQCRYESAIIVAIMGIMLFPFLIKIRYFHHFSIFTCLLPVFSLPILWQRKLLSSIVVMSKTGVETFTVSESPFSLVHFMKNIDDNIFVLLGLNPDYGYSLLVSILSLVGLYISIRIMIINRPKSYDYLIAKFGIASFIVLLCIISSFHWGNFTIPMDTRLSFVFLPFLTFSALQSIKVIQNKHNFNMYFLFTVCIFNLFYYWPVGSLQSIIKLTSLPYEYENVLSVLEQHSSRKGYSLILSEYPTLYTIQNYSAVHISNKDRIERYLKKPVFFDRIIMVQKFEKLTGRIYESTQLPLSLSSRTISEISISPTMGVRLSEIYPQ